MIAGACQCVLLPFCVVETQKSSVLVEPRIDERSLAIETADSEAASMRSRTCTVGSQFASFDDARMLVLDQLG